jgi:hypothetical protein
MIGLLGFGSSVVVLGGFGGATMNPRSGRPWQNILISFAGPAIGFLLSVVLALIFVRSHFLMTDRMMSEWIPMMIWANRAWAIFNLIPILPLDGGNILRQGTAWFLTNRTSFQISVWVSMALALVLTVFGLAQRNFFMAAIAGCFAVLGLEIRSARTLTIDDVAMSMWEVTRPDVDIARVRDRLLPVLRGEVDLASRLALNPTADEEPPRIRILPRRSATATLIEVRAQDRRGLVWTVCREIVEAGHSIRSAHLSTYGTEARDVFYVVDADQGRPLDDDAALAVRTAIAEALQ